MKTVIISIIKIILMIIFLYIINNLVGFFFGNLIPHPDEMRGAVFIYLFIFICEMILAYLSSYMVFKIAKMEK